MSQDLEIIECPPQPQPEDTHYHEVDLSRPEHFSPVAFANLPLYIPTMTQGVIGFDGGLNRAALNVHPDIPDDPENPVKPNKGVLCILLPYLQQALGDFVELYCGSTLSPVASHTVTESEANNGLQIVLFIPTLFLPEGSVENVFFRVTRIGGGMDETKRFRLKVDTLEPGGPDPDITTPVQNENLAKPIFPQHIIDEGVTPVEAGKGIKITIRKYPVSTTLPTGYSWQARDKIIIRLGNASVVHSLTEGEAAGNSIDVVVYAGTWNQVDDGECPCQYTVVDEVGNYARGWSPIQLIYVNLKNSAPPLKRPFIYEVNNDGDLNIEDLQGQDATIGIYIRNLDYQLNDLIRVKVEGRTQDNATIIYEYEHHVLTTARDANIPFPFEDIWPLVKGILFLSYERIRAGMPVRRSEIEVVAVIGTGSGIGLPPPIIEEAPDGNLPADVLFVTVRIAAYPGQKRFDGITLWLVGTYANGAGYYREIGPRPAGTGTFVTRITNGPDGDIAQLEGGTLDIQYTVTPENGGPVRVSRAAHLEVGDNVASLPVPVVEEAPPPEFIFDPEQSPFGATVVVRKNFAFTLNSTVYLHWEGSAVGGSTPPQPFKITSNWLNRDLYFEVDRRTVLANIDRSARTYYTLVKDYERTRFSHAQVVKVGSPLFLNPPEILEATSTGINQATINPLHVVIPPVFTIRVRYAMHTNDQIIAHFEGKQGLGTPTIPAKLGNSVLNYVDFTVSNTAIAANLDETCFVRYTVIRGGAPTESRSLVLNVQPLPSSSLDVVSIPEAVDGVIDAHNYNSVLVRFIPFMKAGQEVWITLKGSTDYLLRDGIAVTNDEFRANRIVETIPADYLTGLANESNLRVEVKVSLDGHGNIDTAIPLVIPPAYQIKKIIGIITHIDVGGSPTRIAASPDGNRIYVTNEASHTVSVINTNTNKVIHTITGLNRPHAIVVHPNGSTIYVSNLGTRTVSVINSTSYEIIFSITGLNVPYSMALNKTGTRLYITCYADHTLYTHDTSTGARLFSLGGCNYASAVALNPSSSRLYVGAYVSVHLIDPTTSTQLSTIPGFSYPRDMAYSPHDTESSPRLYVANTSGNNVIIINAGANIIHKALTVAEPFGIAINPIKREAYVTSTTDHSVKIIDTTTETITDAISGFNRPAGLAVLPNGSKMYVANHSGHTVTVVAL